jgi:hypothetical protein
MVHDYYSIPPDLAKFTLDTAAIEQVSLHDFLRGKGTQSLPASTRPSPQRLILDSEKQSVVQETCVGRRQAPGTLKATGSSIREFLAPRPCTVQVPED